MKTKLTLFLTCWLLYALPVEAQSAKTFFINGGHYKLTALCEWLNKEQNLNISFNHDEKALQKIVSITSGNYTFDGFFNQYFRPNQLAYKMLGSGIIIYANKSTGTAGRERGNQVTINGYITDSASGERLQGATVAVLNKELGAVSNNYGFYSLTIPEGINNIIVNFLGYDPIIATIDLQKDTAVAFKLAPVSTTLSTVTVTSEGNTNKHVPIQNSTQVSMIDLPIETIEAMPKLLGETDVFRSMQFLPGVQTDAEVSSGLYIRGGSPDQNLVLLDGVPVYNASHLFGLFSVFNADALQSVQLYKGGFPARYGGRLSSVVDIRMKEGNKNAWHGEGGIGLIASRFTIEGPLSKGRSSVMASGRITNWGPLIKWVSQKASDPGYRSKIIYEFYDLNLKSNFYLGKKDHLYISGYFGKDRYQSNDYSPTPTYYSGSSTAENHYTTGLKWGNATTVARWNHQFTKKIFSNATIHFSRYQYYLLSSDEETILPTQDYRRTFQKNSSDLKDIAIKYDIDIVPNPAHYIRTGLSATRHAFVPGVFHTISEYNNSVKDTVINGGKTIGEEYDVYIEDDMSLNDKLKTNIGMHGTGFRVGKTLYTSLQPRINLRYLLHKSLSLKSSLVYMNQFIHLLTNSGIGLPTDLWVPVTEKIPPQKSIQYTLGAAYTSPKEMELSIEGYYKYMKHVIEYEEGATFTNTTVSWEDRVETGKGKGFGVEVLAQKKKGKITGLAGYTWSKSTRTFPNINDGYTFPYHYDRRHDFKTAVNYKLSKKTEVNIDWVLASGQAFTVPLETYVDQNGQTIIIYSKRNSFRMPVYHRADLSLSLYKQKRRYLRTWIIGVYNVYSRRNPFYIRLGSTTPRLKAISVMPFPIPSITYQIKF